MTKPIVTREEVSNHNQPDDLWIIVQNKVYRIPEKWLGRHPGGRLTIMSVAGKDATEPFTAYHDDWVWTKKLAPFYYADLAESEHKVDKHIQEFRELESELRQKGYFETDYSYYLKLGLWLFSLFFLAIYFYFTSSTFTGFFISAVFLGFFWQQSAFLGHDLCHNAVTHSRFVDTLIAETMSVLIGISAQWWKHTHNVHHVVTNSVEFDPDIQHLPIFAVTEKYFKNIFSRFHNRVLPFDSIAKVLVSRQDLLYYPVMCLSRLNLNLQGIILHLKSHDEIPFKFLDLFGIVGYLTWYSLLIYNLPDNTTRIMYFLVSHLITGLLAVQITISHFAMPTYEGVAEQEHKYDFVKTQFHHSMDVDCPKWLDWLHGGLQFQVVHHLFPRVPRHKLRELRDKYIVPFAKKNGFTYHSYGFVECNVKVLSTLRNAATKAKKIE